MKNIVNLCLVLVSVLVLFPEHTLAQKKRKTIERFDNAKSQILQGISIPADRDLFFTSGMVAPVADSTAGEGSSKRYGDTYTQSINTLSRIENALKSAGLSMKDVISLRIYLAPDPNKDNQIDFEAWFKAYPVFFMNEKNPNKVVRTTVGVAALARKGLLVEIEAIAVFPK
jgi:enamine deaminase RidA (YjgF/YER057c/UK114 family)